MAANALADFISNAPHVWIGCKKLEAFLDIMSIAFRLFLAETLHCIKIDCEKVLIGSLGKPILAIQQATALGYRSRLGKNLVNATRTDAAGLSLVNHCPQGIEAVSLLPVLAYQIADVIARTRIVTCTDLCFDPFLIGTSYFLALKDPLILYDGKGFGDHTRLL